MRRPRNILASITFTIFNTESMSNRIVLSSFLTLFICVIATTKSDATFEFAVVIDAGSTSNRVMVYRWPKRASPESELRQIETLIREKVSPSLDVLQNNNTGLKAIVTSMVSIAKNKVPQDLQSITSIYFFATAGMRMVIESKANTLFGSIDNWLSDKSISPFKYEKGHGARILSGEEEGAFMWISVNYLLGVFKPGSTAQTTGTIELGGASTQIAFEPDGQQILDNKFPLRVLGRRFSLYVHSYLYYGLDYVVIWINENLALAKLSNPQQNPCMVAGDTTKAKDGKTITGTGDPGKCQLILNKFVYKVSERCYAKPCAVGTTYQPTIHKEEKLMVLGAFYYSLKDLKALGSDGKVNLNDVLAKAEAYCRMSYKDIETNFGLKAEFISKVCIANLYLVKLLNRGYGISMDTNQLIAANKINDQELSWSMGALLYESLFQFKRRR